MEYEFRRFDIVVFTVKGEMILGIIDEISKDFFIMTNNFDKNYDYGLKIPMKYFSNSFLFKIGEFNDVTFGTWEIYKN